MNLINTFNNPDILMDCTISIIQEAKKNGFKGFAGNCAQAAIIINECLFDNSQTIFASFNKALEQKDYYIGHVACLVELDQNDYFIIDSDAKIKSIEDIEHWGMLDSEDIDYQKLFKKYSIKKTIDNFENVSSLKLEESFVRQHFDFSSYQQQFNILSQSVKNIIPLFVKKNQPSMKIKL